MMIRDAPATYTDDRIAGHKSSRENGPGLKGDWPGRV